ncbi:MAG: hypothetical protein WCY11_02430, partial [Novosphingobium sp.]
WTNPDPHDRRGRSAPDNINICGQAFGAGSGNRTRIFSLEGSKRTFQFNILAVNLFIFATLFFNDLQDGCKRCRVSAEKQGIGGAGGIRS